MTNQVPPNTPQPTTSNEDDSLNADYQSTMEWARSYIHTAKQQADAAAARFAKFSAIFSCRRLPQEECVAYKYAMTLEENVEEFDQVILDVLIAKESLFARWFVAETELLLFIEGQESNDSIFWQNDVWPLLLLVLQQFKSTPETDAPIEAIKEFFDSLVDDTDKPIGKELYKQLKILFAALSNDPYLLHCMSLEASLNDSDLKRRRV